MIRNDIELQGTLERIQYFYRMVEHIRATQANVSAYKASAGGFLAEIAKMNREAQEYLAPHPSEMSENAELIET